LLLFFSSISFRDRVYRLSLQLDVMQKVEWEASASVIDTCIAKGQSETDCRNYIMSINEFDNKLLICGSYAFSPRCTWRNVDSLALIKEEHSIGKSPFNPKSNVTTLMTNDGKMFIGSTIDFSSTDSAILRADLSLDNSKILRTEQYNNLVLRDPQFVGSFEHGEFIYFVFREISNEAASFGEKAIYSRIARVCKNDAGN
jgi:semaphorin 5